MQQEDWNAQKLDILTMSKQELHNNTVERRAWQAAAFSHDSEHLAGVTPEHKVYVWSLHRGKLEKFLEFDGKCLSTVPVACCCACMFTVNVIIVVDVKGHSPLFAAKENIWTSFVNPACISLCSNLMGEVVVRRYNTKHSAYTCL